MRTIEIIWVTMLIAIYTSLGFLYSIHNTDSHHWGFITGTALDYIEGKTLFREVYVQYGVGQLLLFKALNAILSINFTSVGFIISIFYSFHLLIIYLGVRQISNATLALLITTAAFVIHTYSIYPWSDYYAGFFITLSSFLLLGKAEIHNSCRYAIAAASLVSAAIFRNTYFFSILIAAFAYVGLCVFNKELRNKPLFASLALFLFLSLAYVSYLLYQGNIHAWYVQGIGTASASRHHLEPTSILHLLQRALFPVEVVQRDYFSILSISVLLYIAVITTKDIVFKREYLRQYQGAYPKGVPLFIALLGLAGIIQALHKYEVFRVQNACGFLYLVAAMFLTAKLPDLNCGWKQKIMPASLGLCFLLHLTRFPHGSSYFPVFEGSYRSYSESSIPFFRWHRFRAVEQNYYDELFRIICGKNKQIVNFTMDSSICDLCNLQNYNNIKNMISLAFFNDEMVSKINFASLKRVKAGSFDPGTVIISEAPTIKLRNPDARLVEVGKVIRPGSIRFFKSESIHIFRVIAADFQQ